MFERKIISRWYCNCDFFDTVNHGIHIFSPKNLRDLLIRFEVSLLEICTLLLDFELSLVPSNVWFLPSSF
jgi:hypothetical protein